MGTFLGTLVSLVVGGAVAVVTVVGVVDSQTGAEGASPANIDRPQVDYGSTD